MIWIRFRRRFQGQAGVAQNTRKQVVKVVGNAVYRIVLAAALSAPLIADQLILDNGDRVTGTVTKKDRDSVAIVTELMGAVTIKWIHVKSIETTAPVTVVLEGGRTVQGNVSTSDDQLRVNEQAVAKTEVASVRNAAEEAKYQRMLHPPIYDLWSGYYDFGIANVSGNSRSLSITNSFNAVRATSNDKLSVYFNQIYAKGLVGRTVGETARSLRGGWMYNHNVGKRAFLTAFNDYDRDRFQGLDFAAYSGAAVDSI